MEYFNQTVQIHGDNALQNTSIISGIIISLTLFLALKAYNALNDQHLPPGPKGIPIFGYWPFLKSEIFHLQEVELKKKYGDIFSFKIMGKVFINLASYQVLKEAYITKSDCFTKRVKKYCLFGKVFENSVLLSDGEEFQTIKKFFSQQFKERGLSVYRENTAETMNETIVSLIEELQTVANNTVDIHSIFLDKIKNVVRQTFFGMNTTITVKDVKMFQDNYRTLMTLNHPANVIIVGKLAWYFIMPFISNFFKGLKARSKMITFCLNSIEEHRRTFDDENIRDVIDSFLKEKYSRNLRGDIKAKHFTNDILAGNIVQLVGDSAFSGATFVTFCIKVLIDHPEEQEKIYNELVEVCGNYRNPEFSDRSKLPYTKAFFQEAQRTFIIVPSFPRLECTTETTINGYKIPKGALTTVNVYAIHNDPNVYENPEKFNPSRFLEKDRKRTPDSPITFSIGKRMCPGESFIMMLSFLFCTAIVKNFRISQSQPKSYYELITTRNLQINLTHRK